MLRARRAASTLFATQPRLSVRVLSSATKPAADAKSKLTKEEQKEQKREEQKERYRMLSESMREQTMREVAAKASEVRPEGVSHMLNDPAANAAQATSDTNERQYAANYDDDRDEWGGPKGDEPTRYGDWERNGRAFDF